MSGSETGVITSTSSQPVIHNMHLAYAADGTAVYKAVPYGSPLYQASNGGVSMSGEPLKKKRGRPRKYGPDGSMVVPPLSAAPPTAAANLIQPPSGAFSSPPSTQPPPPQPPQGPPQVTEEPPANVSFKKARGRPPGSSKKHQLEALGSPGIGFTPHVITMKAGEGVFSGRQSLGGCNVIWVMNLLLLKVCCILWAWKNMPFTSKLRRGLERRYSKPSCLAP